jgi:hypothetical protein
MREEVLGKPHLQWTSGNTRMNIFFFLFGGAGVWYQGIVPTRKALYCTSHATSPFCSGYFGDRVSPLVWLAWTTILLFMSRHCWDDSCAPPQPVIDWDGVLWTILPKSASQVAGVSHCPGSEAHAKILSQERGVEGSLCVLRQVT